MPTQFCIRVHTSDCCSVRNSPRRSRDRLLVASLAFGLAACQVSSVDSPAPKPDPTDDDSTVDVAPSLTRSMSHVN